MTKTARRLETAIHEVRERRLGLRAASRYYHVPYSTLRDNSKSSPSTLRAPRGRPPCLTKEEELLIESAILEFADHAFPLRKSDIQDLIQLFAFRLPINRRHRLPFKHGRPGNAFFTAFMRRHPKLQMRRRAALEMQRKLAMCPRTFSMHYARLVQVYKK